MKKNLQTEEIGPRRDRFDGRMLGGHIGVDLSGGKVRTVTVTKGIRGKEISKSSFPAGAEIFKEENLLGVKIVTAMDSAPLVLRVLRFPFTDSKKLRTVYRFELENSTGFPIGDDVVCDYHLVRRPDGVETIVPAFGKQAVQSHIDSLTRMGIDPNHVTFSPVAFSSLDKVLSGERPLLLIDMDQDHLNFSFFDDAGLLRVRNCDDAIFRLKKELGEQPLDFTETEKDGEGKRRFFEKISVIAEETLSTARFFENQTAKGVKSFVLSGGVCGITGVEERLGEELGVEIKRISIPDIGEQDSPFFAKAYALALYGGSAGVDGGLNLRRNGHRDSGLTRQLFRNFRAPVVLFACLMLVLVFGKATEEISARSEASSIRSEMRESLRREFPEAAARNEDPIVFYRKELELIKSKLEAIKQIKGSHSPLEVLLAVSSAVPADSSFRIDEIKIEDGGKTRIWGRCNSYEEIASVEKAFSRSDKLAQVKREQVNQAVDNSLKFVVSMVVR